MAIYYYHKEFSPKHMNDFVKFVNDLDPTESLRVYLYAENGGEVAMAMLFKDILEKRQQLTSYGSCTLIGCGHLYSAGLIAFFETNVPKRVLNGTLGMWHRPTVEIALMTHNGKPVLDGLVNVNIKASEEFVNTIEKLIDPSIPEQRLIKKGEDVYLTTARINQMLKKQNKYK